MLISLFEVGDNMSILTQQEAANALRLPNSDDPLMMLLLPSVDDTIKTATGHDWAADTIIDPTAKLAAILMLVSMHTGIELSPQYAALIGQLHAKVANGEI